MARYSYPLTCHVVHVSLHNVEIQAQLHWLRYLHTDGPTLWSILYNNNSLTQQIISVAGRRMRAIWLYTSGSGGVHTTSMTSGSKDIVRSLKWFCPNWTQSVHISEWRRDPKSPEQYCAIIECNDRRRLSVSNDRRWSLVGNDRLWLLVSLQIGLITITIQPTHSSW